MESAMKTSPYIIGVIFHYHCTPGDYPKMDTPAFESSIQALMEAGIIIRSKGIPGQEYEINREAADVYVEAILSVPLPVLKRVTGFRDSDTGVRVSDLSLSVRALRALRFIGIDWCGSVKQLENISLKEVRSIRGVGAKTIYEIESCLSEIVLTPPYENRF